MRTLATALVLLALTAPARANDGDPLALLAAITAKDTAGVEARVAVPLGIWKLWFADSTCQKEFGMERRSVTQERLPAFIDCLGDLGLTVDAADSFVYDPGVPMGTVWKQGKLTKLYGLAWKDDVPSVTTEALSAHLKTGSLDLKQDKATRAATKRDPYRTPFANLNVCIDATGKVTSATVADTSIASWGTAVLKAAKKWRFRPFKRAGKAIAVCAHPFVKASDFVEAVGVEGGVEGGEVGGVVGGDYSGSMGAPPPPPPPPPAPTQNVPPTMLEASRTAGEKMIVPDEKTKTQIRNSKKDKIIASFKLCLDVTGAVTTVLVLKSSGFPAYDEKIKREMNTNWAYRPYLINGKAVPVCTAVTFIYSQK